MQLRKLPFSPLLWMLLICLIATNWQPSQPTQEQPTQADDSLGLALLEQSEQLYDEQKYSEALKKTKEARNLFEQKSNWDKWAECLELGYKIARDSKSKDLTNEMARELDKATVTIQNAKDIPAGSITTVWWRRGIMYHNSGDYTLAYNCYEKALPFAEMESDSFLLTRLYSNIGIMLWSLGDDYRSLNYFDKSLSLAETRHDTLLLPKILLGMGNTWRTIQPSKALPVYQKALELDPNNPEGLMLLSKYYLEAEKDYATALQIAQVSLNYANAGYDKADALHQIGRVKHEQKKYDDALRYYHLAMEVALTSYGPKHDECAKIPVFIGRSYSEKKEYHQALLAFNQSLQQMLPLFTPQTVDDNPDPSALTATKLWIMEALIGKSKVYEKMFADSKNPEHLERSLQCAELALFYQNKIKLRHGDDESKFALGNYFINTCDAALHSALQLYRQTGNSAYARRAFSISEQNKAVVLAEALYRKEMKQVANVPTELLLQEREHQQNIAYYEKKLLDDNTPETVLLLKDSLFQSRRNLEVLEQRIVGEYPAYGNAMFNYRSEVSPDSIRRQIPADAAMVEYFMGDNALYTFVISADTFWVQENPLPEGFNHTVDRFLRTVNDWQYVSDSSGVASDQFLETGNLLYQWLLEKPMTVTNAKRIFIIPDGKLSLVPFELLLSKPYRGQWIDRDVPYLIKERSISYRFSCKGRSSGINSLPEQGWGGFGLEYGEGTLSATDQAGGNRGGLRNYGPLPFADDEIMAIKGVLGGAFWLNSDATRNNFLKNAEKYGIIHLAMHGIVDESNPLRSRLLFSTSIAGEDPNVYASDLYNLQLRAGLSVLSSCQSGNGAWRRGEGVLSLARAFAFAGCPSMIMSLWNVSDQSTSDLMVSFYQFIKQGLSKDEALRNAKLEYLSNVTSEYAKPIYWAAFVPIGDMTSLSPDYFSERINWTTWGLGVIALAALIGLALWTLRRRQNKDNS